ncbi:MAG: acyl carrier protein [Chlamydiia bacterium]|nr:acyl carrier protein [Chlamydiia bacterium]
MTVEDEVIDIIVEQLGVDKSEVTRDKSIAGDLSADSLDLMELIMTLEEHFKCEITDDETEKLTTVGAVIDYVNSKRSAV